MTPSFECYLRAIWGYHSSSLFLLFSTLSYPPLAVPEWKFTVIRLWPKFNLFFLPPVLPADSPADDTVQCRFPARVASSYKWLPSRWYNLTIKIFSISTNPLSPPSFNAGWIGQTEKLAVHFEGKELDRPTPEWMAGFRCGELNTTDYLSFLSSWLACWELETTSLLHLPVYFLFSSNKQICNKRDSVAYI